MADVENVVAKFAAPVPLGHRVEVVWYQTTSVGWRGASTEEYPHVPKITDLETGIEYLNSALVKEGATWTMSEPRRVSDEVSAPFEIQRVLVGKVRRCRLITVGAYEIGIQTHLDIEPDTEQPPFR